MRSTKANERDLLALPRWRIVGTEVLVLSEPTHLPSDVEAIVGRKVEPVHHPRLRRLEIRGESWAVTPSAMWRPDLAQGPLGYWEPPRSKPNGWDRAPSSSEAAEAFIYGRGRRLAQRVPLYLEAEGADLMWEATSQGILDASTRGKRIRRVLRANCFRLRGVDGRQIAVNRLFAPWMRMDLSAVDGTIAIEARYLGDLVAVFAPLSGTAIAPSDLDAIGEMVGIPVKPASRRRP